MPTEKKLGEREFKSFTPELKDFDDKSLTITHFISTETQDSDGDVMRADGMKTRGKIVVLFHHGKDAVMGVEPVAKCLGLSIGQNAKGARGILAKTQFFDGSNLTPPDNTGERLYQKCKQGVMPNWSVGFERIKQDPMANGGTDVKEWSMFEYSITPVGANAEATTKEFKSLLPLRFIFEEEKPEGVSIKDKTTEAQPVTPSPVVSLKTIADRTAYELPDQAISTLHYAMKSEMANQVYKDDVTMETDCGPMAKALLDEYHSLALPYVQKCMEAIKGFRFANKNATMAECKTWLDKLSQKEKTPGDPAPGVPVLEAIPNEPQVVLKLKSLEAPKALTLADDVKTAIESVQKKELSIPFGESEINAFLSESAQQTRKACQTLFNRLTGKLER